MAVLPFFLIALGFLLLYVVSGTPAAPVALLLVGLSTYYGVAALLAAGSAGLRKRVQVGAVPLALGSLLLLNLGGLIGTLTGSQGAGINHAVFLAAPFYVLAAGAFVSDVAGGRLPLPPLRAYLLYLALPFKLLAGPIEFPRLIGGLQDRLRFRWRYLKVGLPWVWLGLFMKYVIANRLDPATRLDLTDPQMSLAVAAIFELKFYFDFAGYSFMAYGLALLVNIRLTLNFTHPFFSRSVVIFWHHWHVSLGRFLSRYLLDPNLKRFGSRTAKLRFASSIFLASALWHGGTFNYLLWGLFHGGVYYGYIRLFKDRRVPWVAGTLAMLAFFVLGRFLAIEADTGRLLLKLASLVDPAAWRADPARLVGGLAYGERSGLLAAALFLLSEWLSLRWYGRQRPYHLHRRPWAALLLLLAFLVLGTDTANLLYARI